MKAKIAIPTTPITMRRIIGSMIDFSISGVHILSPSNTYIIRANMVI